MKPAQRNVKNKWEESGFSHSHSFYRSLCLFQINVRWSKEPLRDIKSSSVSESCHRRTAQCQGAISWSDVRLYLWERERDKTKTLKRPFKQCCLVPHSSVLSYKATGELTRQCKRERFPVPSALTSTTYSSPSKAHLPQPCFKHSIDLWWPPPRYHPTPWVTLGMLGMPAPSGQTWDLQYQGNPNANSLSVLVQAPKPEAVLRDSQIPLQIPSNEAGDTTA